MNPIITLTWPEVMCAVHIGVMRHIHALKHGHTKGAHGLPESADGWGIHIEGAAGELAFAKWRGVYWPASVNTFRQAPDVGRCEIRTRSRPDYELLVHQTDHDDAPYVLVRGQIPTFEIVGWVLGCEAKREEWWKDYGNRRPAYFVPDEYLHTLDVLP